ncbi:hypothetical protein B1690_05945 [Geobacillus sp. 46C-IIa]|uniref:DUF2577 family protein n=1 Tax=Geobacillus sp. 46C-IIa TaxID=1963025 RepID=UPI0009BD41DF|nr:DUF2577 family protein [Geobacillus sp. 46C-IIa]OQP06851.1 hypothetical protein B1690_05945 [Geobacillus sp. 46C-IIa]QNU27431.1 DUF2577 domain-containing protein [Geobacillus sp. 46C-IIa]
MEGNGAVRLIQLMRQHGYNKDISIELATVTSPPPNIKIRVDNMKIELDKDDVIIAQHLTKHKRQVRINGGTTVELEHQDELKVGDRVIVASDRDQVFYIIDRAVMVE